MIPLFVPGGPELLILLFIFVLIAVPMTIAVTVFLGIHLLNKKNAKNTETETPPDSQ